MLPAGEFCEVRIRVCNLTALALTLRARCVDGSRLGGSESNGNGRNGTPTDVSLVAPSAPRGPLLSWSGSMESCPARIGPGRTLGHSLSVRADVPAGESMLKAGGRVWVVVEVLALTAEGETRVAASLAREVDVRCEPRRG